ncbi:uncharacterized protein M6B38_138915 [Iris pallida]|uniref:E3 ubiquitin-protein ligase RMA n=1 Tax=Iris pallida TaxID=29817 RepID=A0AAX6FCC6_IRIPA|nr:uncharacterized protein M6B38_138915 [Iris pallida]
MIGLMDLNLYLGPARSARPESSDLGSDLALGSLPASDGMSSPPSPSDPSPSDPPIVPGWPVEETEPSPPLGFRRLRRHERYSPPPRSPPPPPSWVTEYLQRDGDQFRLLRRRFRTTLPTRPGPELLTLEMTAAAAAAASSHKVPEVPEEEDKEENKKKVANFECNVCLDLANEPVVTSCGHLFCWPCLYQWLHVHSEHKECPVCKGEVSESNITPIYGRGSENKEVPENGDEPGSAIPPRPRGNRLESFRQKFPPITRRFGEGFAASWRRLVSQQMRSGNPGLFSDGPRHAVLTRLRARRLMREGMNSENGPDTAEETRMPGESTEGEDLWNQFSLYELEAASRDRLAALAADIGRVVRSNNRYGASTSSVNPSSPEHEIPRLNVASTSGTDQASASSTVAMIQGDAGIVDGSMEPDVAGSSRSHRRSYRRRERSSASGSLDVDEGVLPARKRRRTD